MDFYPQPREAETVPKVTAGLAEWCGRSCPLDLRVVQWTLSSTGSMLKLTC